MITIRIHHGVREFKAAFPEGITFGQVAQHPEVKAALALSDNVISKLDGVQMLATNPVPNNAVYWIETASNDKG